MKTAPVLNLQDIVDSYEDPAVLVSDQYEIITANSAYLELYDVSVHTNCSSQTPNKPKGEKKQYCYEVSHRYSHSCDKEGESCPLQLAKSTQSNHRVLHVHHTRYGEEHVDVSLYPIRGQGEQLFFLEVMKTIKHASPISAQKGMVGKSPSFIHLLSLVNRVAEYNISVLLQGESGSGKELVSYAIHQASQRSAMACVTVECSGLSETLFESELFGHEKGSFTGAVSRKKGLVEEAEGGTLFLDEIGDVPLSLQVKLLRLIETRTFRRVGGVDQLNTDFRLICATHKNLQDMVRRGEFREDLYYRISTFPIRLPALRDRKDDIPLLVATILERISGNKHLHASDEVLEFFKNYSFPGNVRQLRNILELGRVMTDTNTIELEHLPDDLLNEHMINDVQLTETHVEKSKMPPNKEASKDELLTLEQHEAQYLRQLKEHFKEDNLSLANKLGISERTLYRKMKALR